MFGIGYEPGETGRIGVGGLQGAFLSFSEHGGIDVGDGDGGLRRVVDVCGVVEEPEGNVPRAAGDVEHGPALGGGG